MSFPDLSIMIPCYNGQKYINECLDKILQQDCQNIEIVIVNDGSTDDSFQILGEYKNKYRFIKLIHQENIGLAKTRNVLINNSVGRYLYFLDIDDYLAENFIEVFDKYKNLNIDIIIPKTKVIRGNKIMKFYMNNNCFGKIKKPTDYLKYNALFIWNKFYRSDFLKENNLFCSEEAKTFEDVGTVPLFFAKAKTFKLLDDYMYYYRYMNGLSKSNNITIDNTQDIFIQLTYSFEKLKPFIISWYDWVNDCFSALFSLIHYHINFILKITKKEKKALLKQLSELQKTFYKNKRPKVFWKNNFYNLCRISGLK